MKLLPTLRSLAYELLNMNICFWKEPNILGFATLLGTLLALFGFFNFNSKSIFPEPSICTYAFRVFDSNTQKPISYSKISLNYGVKLDIKQTYSEGYYQFNIPCHKDKVLTKVKIEASVAWVKC